MISDEDVLPDKSLKLNMRKSSCFSKVRNLQQCWWLDVVNRSKRLFCAVACLQLFMQGTNLITICDNRLSTIFNCIAVFLTVSPTIKSSMIENAQYSSLERTCVTTASQPKPAAWRSFANLVKIANGFSLVEVVMALGLCSFALMALVSLMPVSLDTSRHALEITRVSKAFQKVSSELTQSQFANVAAMTSGTWYFDYQGNAASNVSDRYYAVTATVHGSPIDNQFASNLLRVELESQIMQTKAKAGTTTITICDMGY
ncbi:MAG: Verru_Chthon cassette protein B [Chthoniobacteraceae bacterium]